MRGRSKSGRRAGFTLLEIMLAVAIMAMIGMTIYDFADTALASARFSAMQSDRAGVCNGLRNLLAAQLASLPSGVPDALIGFKLRRKGTESDTLQLVCPPGNGVLAPDALGYYQLTLSLREVPRGSGQLALGIDRTPRGPTGNDDDDDDDDDDASGATPNRTTNLNTGIHTADLPSDWVLLADGVRSLEIAYFDHRLNSWVERWSDQSLLPDLLRVRLTFVDSPTPYEMVVRVPGGGLKRTQPVFAPSAPITGAPARPAPGSVVR